MISSLSVPSADGWAGPASQSADGRDERRAGWACRSVRRRPESTARRPGLPVRRQTAGTNGVRAGPFLPLRRRTAGTNGAPRAGPADPSADGRDQRRAGQACWFVGRQPGLMAHGPGLSVRRQTAGSTVRGLGRAC